MKTKKLTNLFLIFTILFTLISYNTNVVFAANTNQENLSISSDAVILLDYKSGKVLYEKNSEDKMYPASTTKIITAIITIEKGHLEDNVTVTQSAIDQMKPGYSSAYLSVGEVMSVEKLLKVLLVHSANDASNVLAEYISGSIDSFVDLMNEKAKELGCEHTHFVTTNGLHDDNHYTTAKDLATIARYCMKNKTFRSIVSMKSCTIPATNKSAERIYKNTNDMVVPTSGYYYNGCIGIKTGYTSEAKNCLISACNKNGMQFIAVVLGASLTSNNRSARYVDSKELYDYAYSNYSMQTIAKKDDVADTIQVQDATKETESLDLVIENDITALTSKNAKITHEIQLNDDISAPIAKNSVIGKITYTVDGEKFTTNLLASSNVEKNETLLNFFRVLFIIVVLILIIIAILYIIKKIK